MGFPLDDAMASQEDLRLLRNRMAQNETLISEIQKWRMSHAGIDATAAGLDYPHPVMKVRSLGFGGQFGLLNDSGLRFFLGANGLTDASRISWHSTPIESGNLTVPYVYMYSSRVAGTSDTYLLAEVNSSSGNGAATFELGDDVSSSVGGYFSLVLTNPSAVQGLFDFRATFFSCGPPILLSGVTSDPASPTDGMLWYRSDIDKFRARVDGTTRNLAWEGSSNVVAYAAKSADYTTTANDGFLTMDASGAARTFTLVTAVGNTGLRQTLKKIDSSTNAVTIDANGSQTIDGVITRALTRQYETMTVVSDGSNWHIEGHF